MRRPPGIGKPSPPMREPVKPAGYGGESAGGAGADGASVAAGMFSGGNSGGKRQFRLPGDKRLTLLVALKPYLSPRRAAAVDSMVRFGKIGELLEGFLPGNGGK